MAAPLPASSASADVIDRNTPISLKPPDQLMSIIGSVVWTPQKPIAGQSVKVDVCGPDGKPYANNQPEYIAINGAAGSAQYLQFPLAGDQKVFVTAARADGTPEQSTVTITVAAAELSAATLATISDPALTKDRIAWVKVTADVNLLTVAPAQPYDAPYHVQFSLVPFSRFVQPPASPAPATPAPTPKPTTTTTIDTWSWDFGDGATATTDSPSVSHDFESALDPTREFHQFDIKITGARKTYAVAPSASNPSPVPTSTTDLGSWTRTLSVHNTYVACKNRGYAVLPVTAGGWATKSGTNFVGDAEIKNNEPVAIQLVSRLLIPVLEDSDASVALTAIEAVDPPVVVPAKGSVKVKVVAPFSHVPDGALGFSAVYSAEPAGGSNSPIAGLQVRATAHFLTHPQYRGKTVPAAAVTPAANPANPPRGDELGPGPDPAPSNEAMPPVAVGNQCDPDNLPGKVPDGLACQITPQTQTIQTSARFLNARKGDLLLCPSVGDASLVDSMFSMLTPAQLYGHSGIMTRNYEQITHCTASEGRLEKYTVGGSLSSNDDGFDPDALKYAWPGVLTQTVDHAVNGEMIADPSSTSGQTYTFQDFLGLPSAINIGSQFVVIPPLVVKPDPMLETSAVRDLLTKVADDAYGNTGRFHYRFYCFTNPAAGLNDGLVAPKTGLNSSSAWAEGTHGAVCSSFIWMMMKGRGVNALGPSKYATAAELSAFAKSLQVSLDPDNQTLDGLFYYSEAQRSLCANWLYHKIWGYVRAQESWFDEEVSQAANYYADQLCNTFSNDYSATPDEDAGASQSWLNPGSADALSPDNFLAWNGPGPQNGVLGYSEPAIYFPANTATVPIYKWASVTQYGKLTGRVVLNGKPAASATVEIPGMSTGTDKDGNYSFDKAPYGPYVVNAKLAWTEGPVTDDLQTGVPEYSIGQASVKVDKADVAAPDIKLKPPNQPWDRQIAIKGYASLDCSEYPDHYTAYPQIEDWVDVGRAETLASWVKTEVSKDATATFVVLITWNADDSVDLLFEAGLDNPGGAASGFPRYNIPAGKSVTFVVGNKDSWLNGRNGYFYNGTPDLEAKNDTLLCSITFTNNEWTA